MIFKETFLLPTSVKEEKREHRAKNCEQEIEGAQIKKRGREWSEKGEEKGRWEEGGKGRKKEERTFLILGDLFLLYHNYLFSCLKNIFLLLMKNHAIHNTMKT